MNIIRKWRRVVLQRATNKEMWEYKGLFGRYAAVYEFDKTVEWAVYLSGNILFCGSAKTIQQAKRQAERALRSGK